jgi:hypothetical protein
MATKVSIKTKLQNLINAGNETTGKQDADLTAVVSSLIEGYGQGGIDTSDATATSSDILKDKSAYVDGVKVVGTIPTYAGENTSGVTNVCTGNHIAEVKSEIDMTTLLATASPGTIYKYKGPDGTFENGALYLVESTELTFTILGEKLIEYKALKGMTWAEFVDSSYNDGRVYIGKYQPTPGNYTPDDRVLYRNRLEDEKDGFYALYNPAVDDYTQKPDTLIVDGAEYLSATG